MASGNARPLIQPKLPFSPMRLLCGEKGHVIRVYSTKLESKGSQDKSKLSVGESETDGLFVSVVKQGCTM